MKTSTQALRDTLYNNDQHFVADLFTFEFADATKRWTSYGSSVSYGGSTWTVGPGLSVSESRSVQGVEVDTCSVTIYPDATTIGGVGIFAAAMGGLFDRVHFVYQRAFLTAAAGTPDGLITEFDGYVSQIEPKTTEVRITARSMLERMTGRIPYRVTSVYCPYELYGAACGASKAVNTVPQTTGTGCTTSVINLLNVTGANVGGTLTIAGETRTIASISGLAVTLSNPLPTAPAQGVTATLVQACDKRRTTCHDRFNNLARFGGFPDLPDWAEG
jgi:hypothetical protein